MQSWPYLIAPPKLSAAGHDRFDFAGRARQPRGQQFVAGGRDQHVVLDAHADFFFGNIDPRLDR